MGLKIGDKVLVTRGFSSDTTIPGLNISQRKSDERVGNTYYIRDHWGTGNSMMEVTVNRGRGMGMCFPSYCLTKVVESMI